jgi:carboxylesterase
MTDSTADRARTAFRHDGGDIGVLLIHGFPGAPGSMADWADHLVAAGYTVRVPLLPGHGTRWQDANRTTFDDWLAAVTVVLQELAATCREVVVCGLSMGGTLTLLLAELYPDAMAGIVLVNPSVLTLRKDAKYLLPALRHLVPAYPGVIGDIAKPDTVEPGYKWVPVKAMYTFSKAWPVVRGDLPRVTVPVLLLHSRVDHLVEPVNAQIVRDEISSTEVTDIVLERSYHVATMDYDAELIFTASVEFIEKVTASNTTVANTSVAGLP